MKKTLSIVLTTLMALGTATAQTDGSTWTLNSRAWSTNYWTTLIYSTARSTVVVLTTPDDSADAQTLERILPSGDLVFPIGLAKTGFTELNDIQNPYYYAFGTPFLHVGDFAVGVDASWLPTVVGLYAGAYFKSQEIVFKQVDDHLRAFYIQPRAGIVIGRQAASFEAGVYYDKTVGYYSTREGIDNSCFSDGLGLDVAFSVFLSGKSSTVIQYSMPFHNFLNPGHPSGAFEGMDRRVGYIMLTHRIKF